MNINLILIQIIQAFTYSQSLLSAGCRSAGGGGGFCSRSCSVTPPSTTQAGAEEGGGRDTGGGGSARGRLTWPHQPVMLT